MKKFANAKPRIGSKAAKKRRAAVAPVLELMESRTMFAAFTPGDIVVYQVGTGSAALTSAATAVYLDEYTPTGTLVQSIALPTTTSGSNNPLTASGTATSEGNLTLSQDGTHLLLTGYDAAPGVASIASTNSSTTLPITTIATASGTTSISVTSTTGMATGDPVTLSGLGSVTLSPSQGTYYAYVDSSSKIYLYTTAANATAHGSAGEVTNTGTYTSGGTITDANMTSLTAREIGIVSANGTINTTTTLGAAFTGNNIRATASVDGTSNVYAAGPAGGIVLTTVGSTATPTNIDPSQNIRGLEISGSQLYSDSGTGSTAVIGTVGSGLPTSGPQTISQLPGITDSSTAGAGYGGGYEFAFATLNGGSTPDTLYIADNYNYGVDKYSLVNGSWTLTGEIGGSSSGTLSTVTGVVAEPTSGGEQIFMTTPTAIYSIVDPYGFNSAGPTGNSVFSQTPSLTTVATAATNEAFRGLESTPVASPTVSGLSPSSGSTAGGTTVTISGAGFNGATAVDFGSTPASSFTVIAPNEISAVAPAGSAGTVNVTVVTPQGTSPTSSADDFTYTVAPVVSSLSVSAGPMAGGTSVTISGSNFTPTSTVSFGATPVASVTYVSSSEITVVSPAESAGTVNVTVTAAGVTSATSSADQFTFAAAPTVTSVAPSTGDDSGGTSVTITGTGFFDGATVTFGGVAASKVVVNSSTSITAVSPYSGSTGAVDVVVTSAGGTSTTSSADQFTYSPTTNADAEALASGTTVTLDNEPVVTQILSQPGSTNGVSYGSWAFLVNDGTGSIDIYGSMPGGFTPTVGETVQLAGTYSPYNALPEIDDVSSISQVSPGNPNASSILASVPSTLTIPQVNVTTQPNSVAGQLIELQNVTISNTGGVGTFGTSDFSATITDGSGNSMVLYYWPSSYSTANAFFDGVAIPSGPVNLVGIADVYGGNQPEFIPLYIPGVTVEKFSMTNSGAADNQGDGFTEVTRGNSVTVTVTRSESNDAATVGYSVLNESAVSGTDYTVPGGTTGTLSFAAGVSQQTITINTSANPGDTGDKIFTVELNSPSGGSGYLATVSTPPQSIVILDPSTYNTVSNNSYNENATIQTTGPRVSDGNVVTSTINAEADNTTDGSNTEYAVLTYNDQNDDPSHVFSPSQTVGAINSIELETVASPESYDVSGPLNVYLASTTLTGASGYGSSLTFDKTDDPEGIASGGQLGTLYTLGTINYNADQAAGVYTAADLTSLDPNALSILAADLKNGTPFTIVVAPGNSTVAASWVGSTDPNDLSPILRFNYSTQAAPTVSGISPTSGPSAGGTTVTINGTNFSGATAVDFGTTPASSFTVNSAGTQITAVDPAGTGTVDVTVVTAGGTSATSSADQFTYVSLPTWLSDPAGHDTWVGGTLTVNDPSTIIADPGSAEPNIVDSGEPLAITPSVSDQDIHVGGITLTNGASLTMTSLGSARTHSNHNVLVVGTKTASSSNPTFSVDSTSKLDLADNDLIIHTGETLALGQAELSAIQALAYGTGGGRNGGHWTGNELTSSAAAARRTADRRETTQLAVVLNNDLQSRYSSWTVGSAVESLNRYDIIVKYTYTGDFALQGDVTAVDASILGLHYNTSGEWADGDTNDDGSINLTDSSNLGLDFNLGTSAYTGAAADQIQL